MNKIDSIRNKFHRVSEDKTQILLTPFVVSKQRKTLYFHIAKTGGSTISNILKNNGYNDNVLTNKKLDFGSKKKYFEEVLDDWDSYFKFTFIRNKYDLLVSLWHYDYNIHNSDFKTFIKNTVMPSKDIYNVWIDQCYLTTIDGDSIFDFVGCFDSFKKDLDNVMNKIGISNFDSKKKKNKGTYNHKIHFSKRYDAEISNLIRSKFSTEIDYFGFEL